MASSARAGLRQSRCILSAANFVQTRGTSAKRACTFPGYMLPGRMGNADHTVVSDPRCDPRLAKYFSQIGFAENVTAIPGMDWASTNYEDKHDFMAAYDKSCTDYLNSMRYPEVTGVEVVKEVITGIDGNQVPLSIHRPKDHKGMLPGCIRLRGGNFCILRSGVKLAQYWRNKLASMGLLVVGVDYRNASGPEAAPFPAAVHDVVSCVQWVSENKASLGITGPTVVTGHQSGGALACATAIEMKKRGSVEVIDGVYAQFPTLYGNYDDPPPELPSLVENDGYILSANMLSIAHSLYDFGGHHFKNKNPVCWPYHATKEDLEGLCPHVITCNELDLNRDEAAVYAGKLQAAGVTTNCRLIMGASACAEELGMNVVPEMHEYSMRGIKGFAYSLPVQH